jgi:hypothetical protein
MSERRSSRECSKNEGDDDDDVTLSTAVARAI